MSMTILKVVGIVVLVIMAAWFFDANMLQPKESTLSTSTPSTSPSTSPEATPADLSRVFPLAKVPTLLGEHRGAWIKTLGTPTESVTLSQETLRRDNLRSLDSWHHGSVDMIVTWNKARLPVYISIATTKGSPVLSLVAAYQLFPKHDHA